MSTIAKKRNIFRVLFGSGIDVEEYEYEDVKLPSELQNVLTDIEKKEENVKKGFNSGKSSKGGIAPKINPDTEKAMRAMHNRVVKKEKPDIEIGD